MTTKDWITITISVIALILSLTTTIISLLQRKYETRRSIRNQLNSIINDLHAAFVEREKITPSFQPTKKLTPEDSHRFRRISDQSRFLVRQAIYLIEQLPKELVSDMEYAEVAIALDTIGNLPQSELYWQKSVDVAIDDYYKSLNTKGYARFLFTHGKYEEARQQYRKAINSISQNTDHMKFAKGELYRSWARSEAEFSSLADSQRLFGEAEREYNSIQNIELKQNGLANLEEAKAATSHLLSNKPKDAKETPETIGKT